MWIARNKSVWREERIFNVALRKLFPRHGFDEFGEDLAEKCGVFSSIADLASIPRPRIQFAAWRAKGSMTLHLFVARPPRTCNSAYTTSSHG